MLHCVEEATEEQAKSWNPPVGEEAFLPEVAVRNVGSRLYDLHPKFLAASDDAPAHDTVQD